MSNQLSEQQYLDIAKKYAFECGYTHARYVKNEDGRMVFNLYSPRDAGIKKGLPFFIMISPRGSIHEIEDVSTIYTLQEDLIKAVLQSE